MCGIVGFLGGAPLFGSAQKILKRMTDTIATRGPDGQGHWVDQERLIALGHRRLAIIELSSAGDQPMISSCGRFVLVFNGEIYNHRELRTELQESHLLGRPWVGGSDTETLLACFQAWGIEKSLKRSVGMFALAIWDRRLAQIILARDRLGEKPLYYGWQGRGSNATFVFGSDLKALEVAPAFASAISRDALARFMRSGSVPSPNSIYEGIAKLPAGTILTVSLRSQEPVITPYWSAAAAAQAGCEEPFLVDDKSSADALDAILTRSVGRQVLADVPVGAFLSGGIDSSLIVSLMQKQSRERVKTFTAAFAEQDFNEANYARQVAQHLNTDHHEVLVTDRDAIALLPQLPSIFSEPFADPSQIPTYLVSKLARTAVKVSLSGDGGDELFGGYYRYVISKQIWQRIGWLPLGIRRALAKVLLGFPIGAINSFAGVLRRALFGLKETSFSRERLLQGAHLLKSVSFDELYSGVLAKATHPSLVVDGASTASNHLTLVMEQMKRLDPYQRMMLRDALEYLPNDILVKVDRASMGVSLESRMPFLDHEVFEFAWRLPQSLKVRDGDSKWILRKVLERYVPRPLVDRPKMGFGVPLAAWLRGPLREWADGLISGPNLVTDGYLQPTVIRTWWREHLSGNTNHEYRLWNALMFLAWRNR